MEYRVAQAIANLTKRLEQYEFAIEITTRLLQNFTHKPAEKIRQLVLSKAEVIQKKLEQTE